MLNIDWFRTYKHVEYSVGALYIAILNLPRHLGYLKENIFLVGIIPGPREPSLHMNSFLEPLVNDLLKLWRGVEMNRCEGLKKVQAVLLCTPCDMPATRKLNRFLGHSAQKGCSRCLKSFDTLNFGEKPDYSGFVRELWPKRDNKNHKEQGIKWRQAKTLTEQHKIEKEYGVRYTELLRLPYFDTMHFSVVDPMHNKLLGTAKHVTALWKKENILNETIGEHAQEIVDKFVTPSDIGRIPFKISSGFNSLNTDQWKNWTLIYSLVALKDVIPGAHYSLWLQSVEVCKLMCSRALFISNETVLDETLMSFCQLFADIFGNQACTPNIDMHGHFKECLLDYGPSVRVFSRKFIFKRIEN